MDKTLIEKRFFNSLVLYDKNAIVQKIMADKLIDYIEVFKRFNKIFEIGCGTGTLTKKIIKKIDFKTLIANDIVDCKKYVCIDERVNFIKGDCEYIQFPSNNNLVISNATFQWINDYKKMFEKIFQSLDDNGILAFTTFGPENFIELREIGMPSINYYTIEEIESFFYEMFDIIDIKENKIIIRFNSYKELFNHIKATGVNAIKYNKNEVLPNLLKYYRLEKETTLTYHPLYFILRAKK
ncbi:MAG TPA: malonyl-ACP O-methyltransferase BioC [Spirochaetota bacterium]|nr:malonyl-ACP O-methyltransferase BioC [Spirochaetota bacterium]HOM37659.1 malonyl-ACP O-methyltransferase BioC [Spirochaetota bacterium]HPQ49617.1 malonyl-ACP O-methyltransferase BioC [Spirochaetota bacterium]